MAAINPPSFEQGGSHPASLLRQMNKFMMGSRGGVASGLGVTQRGAGANMSVDVAEGFVFVPGTEASYQGHYGCEAQGVTNVVISASDPTNPRRDLIIARVRDAVYSGAANTWSIEVVTGTPAASPADPALPTGSCWVLARVAVAALAASVVNANITDARSGGAGYTGQSGLASAFGGVVACTSALRPTVGLYQGMHIYETDTGLTYVYTGSAWTWANARGCLSFVQSAVDQTGITTSFVDLTSLNTGALTIPTGRKIRVEANISMYKSGSDTTGWGQLQLLQGASVILSRNGYMPIGTFSSMCASVTLLGTASGSVTFKAQLATNVSFINAGSTSSLAVYDEGPT